MTTLWNRSWMVAAFMAVGATLGVAAPTRMPRPGSLNSVQGQVTLNGHPAQARPLRQETLRPGQVIETRQGKAGLLLTPGSFLRIGNNSEVRMLSATLENTRVRVIRGEALLDAEAGYKHDLAIFLDGARTRIDKKGIYGFNANRETISVLRGKATVYGQNAQVTLKKQRQLDLAGQEPWEVRKLNKQAFESGSLFQWNKIRNRYERRATRSVQQAIAQSGHWYGPGWYWSPYWGFYAYLHSSGMYYSPYYGPYNGPWGWNNWGWGGWGWGDGDGD